MSAQEQVQKASEKISRQVIDRINIDTPALLNLAKHCNDNAGKSVKGSLMGIFKHKDASDVNVLKVTQILPDIGEKSALQQLPILKETLENEK